MELYYLIAFALSCLLTGVYMFIWHRHFDVHITLVFVLAPVTNMGFWMMARAQSQEAAIVAFNMTFLGGCFLELMVMLMVFSLCDIHLSRWIKTGMLIISATVYAFTLTIRDGGLFYKSLEFVREGNAAYLQREYGPVHSVFRGLVAVYFAMSLACILYSFWKKKQISRKILALLFLPVVVAVICYYGGRRLVPHIELMPVAYAFGQIMYLTIVLKIGQYDVEDTAVDTMVQTGSTGLATFDFHYHYLGSNQTAKEVFPELNNLTVDLSIRRSRTLQSLMTPWMEEFLENPADDRHLQEKNGKIYLITTSWLYNGKRRKGYQLTILDDTKNQENIRLLNDYNDKLEAEVRRKTEHIVEMHDQLIMSMATMVESRDNSTGGHIRRTSEGVRILTAAMQRDPDNALGEEYRRNLIKAAPMHDLGKIAVDDDVLRKPGRFTPEEYEEMKKHAPEGLRIVHEILKGTDDDVFRKIAENVAHYHHERWDGNGYPEKLKGEEIPLEARIMAVADVYDALVSKRVYKEKMSFEKADAIMMEGMGSQFDSSLEKYYVESRPALEAYYSSLE